MIIDEDAVLQGGDPYPEEAIPLVIFNEEKKLFELNEEGRHHLSQLEGPMGIIAVAGMYRTGKSYLLNRMLLDRSDGFGVGPTINPCTKGVWMWGRPVDGLTPEGEPIKVIILDTEGLGALDEDSNHDVRIFSLAILLSSFFIYNSVGSIDENALQNLSLVINLTKHIQIKKTGIQEEVDPDEYSKYFPSFMWVVRDFTLQLVDGEGEQISPKEYLEQALRNQKGFSDAVEQKNRIRRLLKSFFSERDCVTMIRPLTNEDKLQKLIQIPMEELRPEFVEQIGNLRRKTLHRVRPKKLNGKNLNGAMFWNLMSSYVDAINKGAIPSIESSWSYICKNECLKAADDSYDIFMRVLHEEGQDGPYYDGELKDIFDVAKKQALEYFNKKAVGDVKADFLNDLKEKMKNKYNMLKQDNDQTCEQECIMFLRQSYTEIERALKNQQYPSFIDFLHDIEQFKAIFEESGPPGSNRKEILLDFCQKAVMESAEFFLGNITNELNLQRTLAEEQIRKLNQEKSEIKADVKDKCENLETKLRKTEMEKAELSAKEQVSREAVQQLQVEKQENELELNTKLSNIKKDYERQMEEISIKMQNAEDHQKEIQRQQQSAESEFDKQKALLDQKIEFLEKAVEDSNKREKELATELRNSKKDFLNQNKEQQAALDKQIKEQVKLIEEMKEQIYEWENKSTDMELQLEDAKSQLQNENEQHQKNLRKAQDNEKEISKKLEQLKKKYDNEVVEASQNNQAEQGLKDQRIQDLEVNIKEMQDTFEMGKSTWAKEEAVMKQKLEFVKYQLDDEKKKFEENKQAHESMLKSLNSSNRESVIGREEAQSKINDMEQKFMNEKKKQEETYNEYRKKLTDQVEQLKKKNNELELSQKLMDSDYSKQKIQLQEQLDDATKVRDNALEKLKKLQDLSNSQLSSGEEKFRQREIELEATIEEKDLEIDALITEHNTKSEQQLGEIKQFYEAEKQRLEKRIQDEKHKAEKKMQQAVEDYEEKLQEMSNNHEDAYNALEDDKNAVESDMQNILNQLEKENQVMQQQIETKEKYLQELKESFGNLQNNSSKQSDQINEKFAKERRELTEKIEQLTQEVSKRERAILSLENSKEGLVNQVQNKERSMDELKTEAQAEKIAQLSKIEELKHKYDNAMDQLTQGKIDFEREKALKDQRLSFQDKRIEEYRDQMQNSVNRYEERLKQEKEEAGKTLAERLARVQGEKENIETKYDQKRKAHKELEKDIQITLSQKDREIAVQKEKYENLERQQQDLIKTYEIENQKLQDNNDQLNQALSQGELGVREQVEHWKGQYYEIERQHADLQSELEKEKALWEGKFEFLERQKDQAKKDNEDALKQFQQTVDQLQKVNMDGKAKHEHNQGMVMQQLENKFKKEIKEQIDQKIQDQMQFQSTIKRLEKDNKNLNERLELQGSSQSSENNSLEKKLERITEDRDHLKEEFESVKQDRERKIEEMRRAFDREKEVLKTKNVDLQTKCKNTEAKQTELILAHETNRAKWDQEKSYLLSAKEDAISELKSIQRKQENSIKEIERLKEQNKRRTKQVGGMTTDGVGKAMMSRFNLGGGGAGLGGPGMRTTALGDNLGASTNFGEGGIGSTYRSNLGGADKSTEFKSAFSSQFGARLGLGGAGAAAKSGIPDQKLGGFGMGMGMGMGGVRDSHQSVGGLSQSGLQTFGNQNQGSVPSLGAAMNQMNQNQSEKGRSSNLLSTPSDRPNMEDESN